MDSDKKELEKIRPLLSPIDPLIYKRWSPRSMTGEWLSEEEICALFEAARMAPSSYNAQPWRFVYATPHDTEWPHFFDLLVDFNKMWCKNAAVLIIALSRKTFEHNNKPSVTHSFDCGAAWMSLALEGASRGLVVHGMSGFDFERAAKMLVLDTATYQVEAMIAVGKRGTKDLLAKELLDKETPSGRKSAKDIVFRGSFSPS